MSSLTPSVASSFKVLRTDLHAQIQNRILVLVQCLYANILKNTYIDLLKKYDSSPNQINTEKNELETLFISTLRTELNKLLQPDWIVLYGGPQTGYALKYKKKSLILLQLPQKRVLILYKAPAHEIQSPEIAGALNFLPYDPTLPTNYSFQTQILEEYPIPEETPSSIIAKATNPTPSRTQILSHIVHSSIEKSLNETNSIPDEMDMAKSIRTHLSRSIGPIWHVIVGKDFRCKTAANVTQLIRYKLQIHEEKKIVDLEEKEDKARSVSKEFTVLIFKCKGVESDTLAERVKGSYHLLLLVLVFVLMFMKFHWCDLSKDVLERAKEMEDEGLFMQQARMQHWGRAAPMCRVLSDSTTNYVLFGIMIVSLIWSMVKRKSNSKK